MSNAFSNPLYNLSCGVRRDVFASRRYPEFSGSMSFQLVLKSGGSGKIVQTVICLENYGLFGFSFLSFYRTLDRIRFLQDIFSKSWLYEGFQVVKSGRMWPVFLRSEKLISVSWISNWCWFWRYLNILMKAENSWLISQTTLILSKVPL